MGRRTPLSRSGSFSLQPAPGGGVTPDCEENQERSRKGVSSWSALTFDLGPPSLSLTLHTTLGSSPPHTPTFITRAPVALLWIRVTRGGVRMQVPGRNLNF